MIENKEIAIRFENETDFIKHFLKVPLIGYNYISFLIKEKDLKNAKEVKNEIFKTIEKAPKNLENEFQQKTNQLIDKIREAWGGNFNKFVKHIHNLPFAYYNRMIKNSSRVYKNLKQYENNNDWQEWLNFKSKTKQLVKEKSNKKLKMKCK